MISRTISVRLGALVIVAMFATALVLGTTACATAQQAGGGARSGGGSAAQADGAGAPTERDAAAALAGFKAALAALPENTAETPAEAAIGLDNFQDSWGDINAAVLEAGRYIVLDLSGCTARDNRIWGGTLPRGNDMNILRDNQYVKDIALPETLTRIDWRAFYECRYLTRVTLPDSLAVIGDSVFSGAAGLVSVVIPESVVSIGDEAFKGTPWEKDFLAAQPNGVVYLGKIAYRYKGTMPRDTTVAIREGTVSIAGSAFYGCEGLASVTLPDSVVSIDAWAFGKSGLSQVSFGNSVAIIRDNAFARCKNLTSLTIPASVTSIEGHPFYNCTSLASLAVEAGNAALSAEDGVLYNKDKTTLLWYPAAKPGSSFVIPKTVTSIENSGRAAFGGGESPLTAVAVEAGSAALSTEDGVLYNRDKTAIIWYPTAKPGNSFVIPGTVKTVTTRAFSDCKDLKTISIPPSVTTIESKAFSNTGLTSVTIPASVTSIGNNAFTDTRLSSVTFVPGSRIAAGDFGDYVFQDEEQNALKTAYLAQGPGTYTLAARTWTKQ
jgi:hypothetical protein